MILILDVFTDPLILAVFVEGVFYPRFMKFGSASHHFEEFMGLLLVGAFRAFFLYFLPSFLIVSTIKLLTGTESIPPEAFFAEFIDPVFKVNLLIIYTDMFIKLEKEDLNVAWPLGFHMIMNGVFLIIFYLISVFQCLIILGIIISPLLRISTNDREVFHLLLSVPLMTKNHIINWVIICTLGLIAVFITTIKSRSNKKTKGNKKGKAG